MCIIVELHLRMTGRLQLFNFKIPAAMLKHFAADRNAVHGYTVVRREIAVGKNILRQYAAT